MIVEVRILELDLLFFIIIIFRITVYNFESIYSLFKEEDWLLIS